MSSQCFLDDFWSYRAIVTGAGSVLSTLCDKDCTPHLSLVRSIHTRIVVLSVKTNETEVKYVVCVCTFCAYTRMLMFSLHEIPGVKWTHLCRSYRIKAPHVHDSSGPHINPHLPPTRRGFPMPPYSPLEYEALLGGPLFPNEVRSSSNKGLIKPTLCNCLLDRMAHAMYYKCCTENDCLYRVQRGALGQELEGQISSSMLVFTRYSIAVVLQIKCYTLVW